MVSEPDTELSANKDTSPQGEWITRSHIGWRRERNIVYKSEANDDT